MIKNFRYFFLVLLVVINPITGIVFGYLQEVGSFIPWKDLGTPPEKAVKIIAADVRGVGVFVKSVSGQIYQCCYGENRLAWTIRSEDEVYRQNFPDCLMGEKDLRRRFLQGGIDNYAVYWCGEWDYGQAYYAIQKDGSVWVWMNSSDTFKLIERLAGYPVIGLLIFGTCGLALKRVDIKNNAMT